MTDEEKQKNYELAEKLFSEQNFAAAGVGIIIGLSMQFLGRGIAPKFAVVAATYMIADCVLGNFFVVVVGKIQVRGISSINVFQNHSLSEMVEQSTSYLSLGNFIYWFIAVFAAVFLAKRPLSRSERLAIGLFKYEKETKK